MDIKSTVKFTDTSHYAQTRPISCVIEGTYITPKKWNWSQLLVAIVESFIANNKPNMQELCQKPLYGKNPFFLKQKSDFGVCSLLLNGFWIYTNYNPPIIVTIIKNLCLHCGVKLVDVFIEYEKKSVASNQQAQSFQTQAGTSIENINSVIIKQSLVLKISETLSERFSNGFRLDSPIELTRLRSFVADSDSAVLEIDDNAFKHHIMACGMFFDGKVYAISAQTKEHMAKIVDEYFNQGAHVIFYAEFFAKHEDWLFSAGVVSEDIMINLLREIFPHLYFSLTFFGNIKAPAYVVLTNEIVRVWSNDVLLSYAQLAERLPYIPLERIKYALGQNSSFIRNSVGTFSHVSKIHISDEERETILSWVADECAKHGYVSIASLPIESVAERNHDLTIVAIHNAVFQRCLADNFDKNGKIVTRKGEPLNALAIMTDYCRTVERCTLQELLDYESELIGEEHRWISMEAANSTLVRIDKDIYVSGNFVNFDVEIIDNAIRQFIAHDYLPIKSFTTFSSFPECGQAWNLFLLESYCRRFSRVFRFDAPSINSRNVGVVIHKDCNLTYIEIMSDAVANAKIDLAAAVVGQFLFDSGYIGKRTTGKAIDIINKAKATRGE